MKPVTIEVNVSGCIIPIDPETLEPRLLQTWWDADPWRVCVTSLLLVSTRRKQVEPMLEAFYKDYPTGLDLLDPDKGGAMLRAHLAPLGLMDQREARLYGFTTDFLCGVPVHECYGVGPYVEAAYRIVHLKDEYCVTDDLMLMLYRSWLRSLPEDVMRWAR